MSEICKTCKGKFDFGIWLSPQFRDEKVLLFCSDKCKEGYIRMKLRRIKAKYPKYHKKIMKFKEETGILDVKTLGETPCFSSGMSVLSMFKIPNTPPTFVGGILTF